jgi:hypothetical protein
MPRVLRTPIVIVIVIVMPSSIVGHNHHSHSCAVDVRVTAGVKNGQPSYQNEVKTKNNLFHLNPP